MKHFYRNLLTLSFTSSLLFASSLQGQTLSGTKTIGAGNSVGHPEPAVYKIELTIFPNFSREHMSWNGMLKRVKNI